MAVALDNSEPVDQNDLQFDTLLSNLQGNILKGHGRDHTANIFVEFHPSKVAEVRAWLSDFVDNQITSAKKQLQETERFKRNGVPGGLFAGLYVTAKGFDYFNTPDDKRPADTSFVAGMENADLNDTPQSDWEPAFKDMTIHVMILLGDDDKTTLSIATGALIEEIRPLTVNEPAFVSDRIRIEYGNAIRNANGDGLEHNGYVDGVSQPLFFKDEIEKFKKQGAPATPGGLKWDPFASLSLVLVPDPLADTEDACGSYYVFRKLEQNVQAFKIAEEKLAKAIGLPDDELAGALIVGRFEDGTPVTLSPEDGMIGGGNANNFDYAADSQGLRCPFHAHVRKTNPRGSGGTPEPLADEKKRIMARRGIPFGQREVTTEIESQPEQFPTGGVGLLFQSFQSDLARQFEFIQKAWANNPTFPLSNPKPSGLDPIIGQPRVEPLDNDPNRLFEWPKVYGQPGTVPVSFDLFVTLRGGQYFFAPSLSGLKAL